MVVTSVTPDGISKILADPNPDPSTDIRVIVQVLDIEPCFGVYWLTVSDGKAKLRSLLDSSLSHAIANRDIQHLGLFCITDYTLCNYPDKNKMYLAVSKYEAVCPPLDAEIKLVVQSELEMKQEITGSALKQEVAKLDAQMGEGCVVNVELTDEDGTQIHATMFNEVARNFVDRFKMGKVYYISKVNLNVENKLFKTVQNDYTTTLNDKSQEVDLADRATGLKPIDTSDDKMQEIVNELTIGGISQRDIGKAAEVFYNDPIKAKVLFALPSHTRRAYVFGFLYPEN